MISSRRVKKKLEKFKEKRKIQNWKIKKSEKLNQANQKVNHSICQVNRIGFFLKWWKMIVMVDDADGAFGVGVSVVQWIWKR